MSVFILSIFILFTLINSSYSTIYTCDPSLSCGCSSTSTSIESRIIGGETAADHAWNWVVSLQLKKTPRCGASILTPEFAITAAHCIYGVTNPISDFTILAGTNSLNDVTSSTIQRRTITKIVMHPNYNPAPDMQTNDIAILQFAPLTITNDSKLGYICLPKQNQDPFVTDDNLIVVGWGVTKLGTTTPSNYLQQVTVQAISPTSAACGRSGLKDSTTQFCAGVNAGGKDSCQGDSGGPLMAYQNNQWILAGLVSVGKQCAVAGYPGIYTRVSSFIPFINAVLDGSYVAPVTSSTTAKPNTSNDGNIMTKSISILMSFLLFLIFY